MGLEGGVKDRRDERTKMKRSPIFAKLLQLVPRGTLSSELF